MVKSHFAAIDTWIFDLDNTLYPPEARLFDQIEDLMNSYIMEGLGVDIAAAQDLRARYWREHGTTLAGLMAHHATDPDHFLDVVHDIDLSAIVPDPALRSGIDALPGRKLVYTNGSRAHGRRVVDACGLTGAFEAIFGIEDANYTPKPHPKAFDRVLTRAKITPQNAAMFEDEPRNLQVPHRLGMRTVLVGPGRPADHVHHQTRDLSRFLAQVI